MKSLLSGLAAAATLAVAALVPATPAASAGFFQNYEVNTEFDIRSIALLQYTEGGGGSTNSFFAPAGSSVIMDPFLKTDPIVATYFLGVSNYSGGDQEPTDHLVLALDDDFAAGILGFEFADLFPSFDEFALISAVDLLASPDTEDNLDDKELAFQYIGDFSDLLRTNMGTFGSTDTFTLVGFSSATQIGGGSSYITSAAIPEPATWAFMIIGFGAAGAMLRRRRLGSVAAA